MPTVSYNLDEIYKSIGKQISLEELNEVLEFCKCEFKQIKGSEVICEITPDRPDLFSTEGLVHFLKGILGLEKGIKKIKVFKENFKVEISDELKNIRPYVVIATIRGVKLDDESLKRIINYQELLHENWCRSRKKASIGLYDLSKLHGNIKFELRKLDEIKFRPLEEKREMSGWEIIKNTEKGLKYKDLILPNAAPVLVDSKGNYLSMAPIINSEDCKVTKNTTDILIDSTGFDIDFINSVVSLMIHTITYYGGEVGIVKHQIGDREYYTSLSNKAYQFSLKDFEKVTGLNLTCNQVIDFLEKARYGTKIEDEQIKVEVPFYRVDILHPIDIIEDLAIIYGYNKIELELPVLVTKPKISKKTIIHNLIRDIMNGFGFQEILNYMLCDFEIQTTKVNLDQISSEIITIQNPISKDFNCIRANLFPCVLQFLSKNTSKPYPQKVYEIGDVINLSEGKIITKNKLAACVIDNIVDFELMHGYLFSLLENFNFDLTLSNANLPFGLEERSAYINVNSKTIGWIAEINPNVLLNFSLRMPAIIFELDLTKTFDF
jgi:phenylalanyl-tRNA synthetase, beta subunit